MGWDGQFADKAEKGELVIGVVGLGYVGLPTALGFYNSGFQIWGIEKSKSILSDLLLQRNPIKEKKYDNLIPDPRDSRWNITDSYSKSIPECDVVVVTVPTPVTNEKQIDTSFVTDAGNSIFSNICKDSRTIVILESTVYPGLTRDLWNPIIEEKGLQLGTDVDLAYCPERYSPGEESMALEEISRIIGAQDSEIGLSLASLYGKLTKGEVTFVGSIEIAESAKLIENVQRDINIALVNELAIILPKLGVDIEDVLDAASSKWNFHRYTPGLGVGGHCIPVDPYFLIDQAQLINSPVHLISSGRKINSTMPNHVANEIRRILETFEIQIESANILILGWSYKPGIGDDRGSPSNELSIEMRSQGISTFCWDPYVDESIFPDHIIPISSIEDAKNLDMIVIATAHQEFIELDWKSLLNSMRNPILYDSRRCIELDYLEEIGWNSFAIGKPNFE